MANVDALAKRIEKAREAVSPRTESEAPLRFYDEQGNITYETPIERAWPGLPYCSYWGLSDDFDDGSDDELTAQDGCDQPSG